MHIKNNSETHNKLLTEPDIHFENYRVTLDRTRSFSKKPFEKQEKSLG